MIELRLYHPIFARKDGGVMYGRALLQFRQMILRLDASGALSPLPEPIEWTEWKDVPTVKEKP